MPSPSSEVLACPRCRVAFVVRNGPNSAGTPTFRCRGCGRRFVAAPRRGPVTGEQQALVERLLTERMALRAIARVPDEYQADAIMCTDFWAAYEAAVPPGRHAAGGKDAGITCHVERF